MSPESCPTLPPALQTQRLRVLRICPTRVKRVPPAPPARPLHWAGSAGTGGTLASLLQPRCERKSRCAAAVSALGKTGGSKCASNARPAQMCRPPAHRESSWRASSGPRLVVECCFRFAGSCGSCSCVHTTNSAETNLSANSRQNHRRGDHRSQSNRLPDEQPPKKKRHHRIHKRISRHPRRRALLQNVDVCCETHHRPKHNQIPKRCPGTPRDRPKMQRPNLSRQSPRNPQTNSPRKALHRHSQ